eukprot:Opistho-2@25104
MCESKFKSHLQCIYNFCPLRVHSYPLNTLNTACVINYQASERVFVFWAAYVGSVFGVFFIAVLYEFFLAALERVDKATRGDGSKAEMSPLLKDSEGRPSRCGV